MEKDSVLISSEKIDKFCLWLYSEERSKGTIEKYMCDLRKLSSWLGEQELTKEKAIEWKAYLLEKGYEPTTINSKLASVNTFCKYLGLNIKVKFYRIQRKLFQEKNKELYKEDYEKMIQTAKKSGNERMAFLMDTLGATGIRVSEICFITVEAARERRTQIFLKGKIRLILLPKKLCKKLLQYASEQKIYSGEIFITKSGKGMSRKQIWAEMKSIGEKAGVEKSKVFPHNFRHLFAREFYKITHDVAKLADILGHSLIETTRIYLLSTGAEHEIEMEKLGMVL